MPDINVVFMDNKFGVKGSVTKNRDGSYTIFINSKLSLEEQRAVYQHELKHVLDDDFGKNYTSDYIELLSHTHFA